MALNTPFINELQHECVSTRKILALVPLDQYDWKPHPKSMSIGRLATHIADLYNWVSITFDSTELDFAKGGYVTPQQPQTKEAFLEIIDQNAAKALERIKAVTDEEMFVNWRLLNDGHVLFEMSRIAVLRSMVMNHLVHHRGQLSVYLRLLDIPIPGMYGPSADEQ